MALPARTVWPTSSASYLHSRGDDLLMTGSSTDSRTTESPGLSSHTEMRAPRKQDKSISILQGRSTGLRFPASLDTVSTSGANSPRGEGALSRKNAQIELS